MERPVIDVYRCYQCGKMITSKTVMKVGGCRFCGSSKVRGTNITFFQKILVMIGVIK